jgi:hypothetical protein
MPAQAPRAEVRGVGGVVYRCAACGEHINTEPWFSDGRQVSREPLELTPDLKTYHQEHLPNGR